MQRRRFRVVNVGIFNSVCVIIVDPILPSLWAVICRFVVNLELELAITHG